MSKVRTVYYCQNCGAQSAKWIGKCASCGEWNTYVEEIVTKDSKVPAWITDGSGKSGRKSRPIQIGEIHSSTEHRLELPDKELQRVLGGGIVPGSLILLGGEPGIGKSTILLQLVLKMEGCKCLYISGEESEQQIKMRAERVGILNKACFILSETGTEAIFQHINALQPDLVVIDSIQTLYSNSIESAPGSVSQIRGCAAELLRFAKESNTPVFLIGHITKDGVIAGPKVLEHMVDTVLQFEGDRNHLYRILRTLKNRFGSSSELGIYEMVTEGLREVSNPSEVLLSNRKEPYSGIAIACTMEGMRPMLIEVQALVSSAVYGTPQRSATGFDLRRLSMLLAVLEKRCGFKLGMKDVFLNLAGGIKVEDPSIDLAVMCAILSSNDDIALLPNTCYAAEVGLSGELRPISKIEQRIKEAEKLGFEKFYLSAYHPKLKELQQTTPVELIATKSMEDVFKMLFG
ncbi:MAG: DNA repair protein RadA [Bacteroidetes bacterium]|nr:DNA repair protein RadA [Bacteroidota bacterium]